MSVKSNMQTCTWFRVKWILTPSLLSYSLLSSFFSIVEMSTGFYNSKRKNSVLLQFMVIMLYDFAGTNISTQLINVIHINNADSIFWQPKPIITHSLLLRSKSFAFIDYFQNT